MPSWTIFESPKASFKTFATLLSRLRCTDARGKSLSERGFAPALKIIQKQTAAGKKLIFIGNGGSAAIASHAATDFFKNGGVRTLAFNDASLITCLSNDYSYAEVFERPVERLADRGDVLFAISSSGRSPNILRGAAMGARVGTRVITLSGFDPDNDLHKMGEINFYVPSHSYAHVENLHLLICHSLLDALMTSRGEGATERGSDRARGKK